LLLFKNAGITICVDVHVVAILEPSLKIALKNFLMNLEEAKNPSSCIHWISLHVYINMLIDLHVDNQMLIRNYYYA